MFSGVLRLKQDTLQYADDVFLWVDWTRVHLIHPTHHLKSNDFRLKDVFKLRSVWKFKNNL